METLKIIPFKPLSAEDTSYIWKVKCTYIACDDEDDNNCKLDDGCAGRYDSIKASSNVQGRKRRSGDGKTSNPVTDEKIVEHPCAYASEHRSICDGNGEDCWTEDVCKRAYSSELEIPTEPIADSPAIASELELSADTISDSTADAQANKILDDADSSDTDSSDADSSDADSSATSGISLFSSVLVLMSFFAK